MSIFKAIWLSTLSSLPKRIERLEMLVEAEHQRSDAYRLAMVRMQENIEDLNSRISALEAKDE